MQQNRENLSRLRRELKTAIGRAMSASENVLREMSRRATLTALAAFFLKCRIDEYYRELFGVDKYCVVNDVCS